MKKLNFKCKYCGKKLIQLGRDYNSNYRFFVCINCERNGGVWIDTKTRIDQHGDKR